MSTESASTTSGPPPASSWATPPEFYLDENAVTRSVRRRLAELGYQVHTPAELYSSREAALDADWLPAVGSNRWTIIGRDAKTRERPAELAAYQRARVHVFLLPGEALAAELLRLVEVNLTAICTIVATSPPGTWRLTRTGPDPYQK
jgi:PIN like domain